MPGAIVHEWIEPIGGRSNLSVDQYFTIDLDYVENWSMILDVLNLLKKVRTLVNHQGAY